MIAESLQEICREFEMQTVDNPKLIYDAPESLLGIAGGLLKNAIELELQRNESEYRVLALSLQLNFIVICAAAIEAHLNWYYYFDKQIDVDNIFTDTGKRQFMSIEEKIKGAPLKGDTKGGVKAIFSLRDAVMHAKYKPRDGSREYLYNTAIMRLSYRVIVDVCEELVNACPTTLVGRISLNSFAKELAEAAGISTLKDSKTNKRLNWIEIVRSGRMGLPMPNRVHV